MRRFLLAAGLAALAAAGVQAQSPASSLSTVSNGSAPSGHIAWPVGAPVWEFDYYRPGNRTTVRGTGLEIRNVNYLGRRVFERASAPVLNVEYDAGGCGCYRDWQDEISTYQATAIAGGTSTSQYLDAVRGSVITNCERSTAGPVNNLGSFSGVAVEDYGTELVLTGHMQAGWYRYRMKWHFYADGRIWPEYSFASAPNSCTSRPRRHHAYWRFDFDLENTPSNDIVTETATNGTVTTFDTEVRRNWGTGTLGNVTRTVDHWTVTDAATQAGFTVTPGTQDVLLPTDAFSKTDALVLRYRTNEIDDTITFGNGCAFEFDRSHTTRNPDGSTTTLPPLLNDESLAGSDNVFWYRSSSARTIGTCELRGPTLTPFNYRPTAGEGTAEAVVPVEVQAATPNPYTSQTSVRFRVAESQAVRVVLYDALGRQVRVLLDQPVEAGVFETVDIPSGDLPAGTYVVRVEGARAAGSTRIVLAR